MTATTGAPSVFEAGLPTLEYDITESPHEVCERIRAAQRRAPIAIGPFGPEVLSYELARSVLRDTRFVIPPGLHLGRARRDLRSAVGQSRRQHHLRGRRRTSSAAQPGIEGIHTAGHRASARHYRRSGQRTGRWRRRRRPLRHRHRYCPPLSDPDHLRIARCATRKLGTVFTMGRSHLQNGQLLGQSRRRNARDPSRLGRARRLCRRHGRRTTTPPDRRLALRSHPRRGRLPATGSMPTNSV